MTRNFTASVGAAVLALSMSMPLTLPAKAQVTTSPGTNTVPRTTTYDRRDNFDWGWLGLIGLLGLAGLSGRKRDDEPTRYRDPNTPGATTYRD
ncbi:WGxxGxxG-CTERM domain-containing protein [Nostocaceae cyanobacterium CENA369]|uniref:WGxxGxxG-CTERM domain-containing protein n=1 Tax=Dendronalium phyllosphericum CENA369 TaxID=1725256 RepID=A0A8J7HY97_9NOST|nr:WGxxGxxG family protein [Dendronalium phyllosphericum]MBH8572506.1 WGxxGxxG-CTERM domain-containing protein [Dendronalium phyllosphericum CENA369]